MKPMLFFCKNCDWREIITSHKNDSCAKCGQSNIGSTSNLNANIGSVGHVGHGQTSLTKAMQIVLIQKGFNSESRHGKYDGYK
ncbi:hypothetical protein [Viridibacillus arvi]|uniref:hypothetical protein n=1 Tax=Viridibacillus arvi TaxID=263475 RepID=UPI0034CDBAE0